RRSRSARRPSTARPAPRWSRSRVGPATSTTPTRADRPTPTRSSSRRPPWPPAQTAARPASRTPTGSPPGPRPRAALTVAAAAALVTLTDSVLAFPFAYYMARVATRRVQTLLFAAVLLPLWASYLARVYAWILILNHNGLLNWSLLSIGLPAANIGYSNTAMWLVFSYIWLPFMIIPVYAALERVPDSLLEAASDLAARRWRAVRDVVLPLALPGVVAGSIFTFSLTLGDYITPILVGGAGSTFIGNVVYTNVGIANNIPFAAALATVPVAIMAVYLFIAQRLGAFEAL